MMMGGGGGMIDGGLDDGSLGADLEGLQLGNSQQPAGSGGSQRFFEVDPARVQDENFAEFFVHFIETFRLGGRRGAEGTTADDDAEMDEGDADEEEEEDATGASQAARRDGRGAGSAIPGSVGKAFYPRQMYRLLLDSEYRRTLRVSLLHVQRWQPENAPVANAGRKLAEHIRRNFVRIHPDLQQKIQRLMDHMATHFNFPHVSYYLQLDDTVQFVHSIRDLRCQMMGSLIAIRGQVTRTSDVRPELLLGVFSCNECHRVERNVVQQFKYSPPVRCSNKQCPSRVFELMLEMSSFGDWQKIRIQEPASDSSAGSMPRAIDVVVRHDLVDRVHAGDRVVVSGALIAIPDLPSLLKPGDVPRSVARQMRNRPESSMIAQPLSGLQSLGVRELSYKLVFLASSIESLGAPKKEVEAVEDKEYYQASDFLDCQAFNWIRAIATDRDALSILAKSVAPRVWGHDDIKKGILLMMTGGVPKATENAKLRGDINMCIVGDPSTAKSQMLKWVEEFAPRAIFTSGKSSTAAGLTAAVHRDPDQGDNVLEAGALMYADQGICCIDEFDKMDEKDRVAIHEAMEQQTISITKAGIQATLNARASVFAACNPRYGRYDNSKTLQQNVNIPPPLLSRFDLLFTMVDEAHEEVDEAIAMHLTSLHMADGAANTESAHVTLTPDEMRLYIECAQKLKPMITDEAKAHLVEFYVALRMDDMLPGAHHSVRITVRQLESLVRLSEGVARLKMSDYVEVAHVREACSIFRASLKRISPQGDVQLKGGDSSAADADDVDAASHKPNRMGRASGSVLLSSKEDDSWAGKTANGAGRPSRQSATSSGTGDGSAAAASAAMEPTQYRISHEDYSRIMYQIVDYIMQQEREVGEADFEGVRSEDLIDWWLDSVLKTADPDELADWNAKLHLLIDRLVERDGILLEESLPDDPAGAKLLRVHPNMADVFSVGGIDAAALHSFGHRSFGSSSQRPRQSGVGSDELEEGQSGKVGKGETERRKTFEAAAADLADGSNWDFDLPDGYDPLKAQLALDELRDDGMGGEDDLDD